MILRKEQVVAHQPIRLRVNAIKQNLSNKEQQIASFILDDPKTASYMTISEMATAIGVADSTIFKFTRKLGYSGFRDFRNDLLTEEFDTTVSVHENIRSSDTPLQMATKVFDSSIQSLIDTRTVLDKEAIERAVEFMLACDELGIYGIGGSESVAADAYHKFLRSPIRSKHATDYHIQLMQASLSSPRDCALVISHTGIDKQAIDIAKILRERQCPIISITSSPRSPLACMSSVILCTIAQETEYRSESLSSRIAQLCYVDALYTIAMFSDEERTKQSLALIREAIGATRVN